MWYGALYCPLSGCTPTIMHTLLEMRCNSQHCFGREVVHAFHEFSDAHEDSSQNDVSVIGPIHPSGQPFAVGLEDGLTPDPDDIDDAPGPPPSEVCPEKDIRVVLNCVNIDPGFVYGGPLASNGREWGYFVGYGSSLMVQTYALEIMAVATEGRMTPLRLWHLAMKQGFYEQNHPTGFRGANYGEVEQHWEYFPEPFPGIEAKVWDELYELRDVEIIKECLMNEGKFWMWIAPDRFPVSPKEYDPPAPMLPKARPFYSYLSMLEKLPLDILVPIFSILPLESLESLASTSRCLRTSIFGNEYAARAWIRTSAPWWIPVPIRMGKGRERQASETSSVTTILPYHASQSTPDDQKVEAKLSPAGLDWAYVRRCAQSGSMRNRQRIWNTVLDIERVADLAGV